KLLLYRLRNFRKVAIDPALVDPILEPRLNQIFVPLKSIVADDAFRAELASVAQEYQAALIASRGFEPEAQLLEIIRDLLASGPGPVSVKAIATAFTDRHGAQYDYAITNRWVGGVLRRKLHLKTHKTNGVYVMPVSELP